MYGEFLKEYEAGLKVRDKYEYMKAARMFVEYFGNREPNIYLWRGFRDFLKMNYYAGTHYDPTAKAVMNCLDRAYRFYDCYKMSREQKKAAS